MYDYAIVVVLGLIALGAVAFPLLVGRERYEDPSELEDHLARYREAVAADTVCGRCRQANPDGSRFCRECGAELQR